MRRLLEIVRRKSVKVGYPLYWFLLYFPGYVLSVILIPEPLKVMGYLAMLFTELWEIGMLHTITNTVSVIFLPVITMHPLIVSAIHLLSQFSARTGLGKAIAISDESLLRLRLGYVIAAYVGITLSVLLREKDNRKQ